MTKTTNHLITEFLIKNIHQKKSKINIEFNKNYKTIIITIIIINIKKKEIFMYKYLFL